MAHSLSKDICTQLIEKLDGFFGPVFQTTLLAYLSELEDHLTVLRQRQPELVCNTRAILLSLGKTLMSSLIQLCSRCFLGELYRASDELQGDTPEARYQDFLQQHLLARREALLDPSTELGGLVSNRVACSLSAAVELLARFQDDYKLLERFLGAPIASLDDWEEEQGDRHNRGRTVAILTVNGSEKLVYKPHSLENDVIFSGLTQWLNQTGALRVPLRHLRVLARGEYGWQEFVAHRPCKNAEEAEHYMYRAGALIFLTWLSACCDLHHENLIANGDAPVLVDTETMFNNRHYLKGYHMESVNPWNRFVLHSVFASGLIPADILPGKAFERKVENGIVSGLDTEQSPVPVQMIVRPGTDEMCFSEEMVVPQETVHPNLPYLDGRPLHAGEYIETVSDGFRDAYAAALAHRESLLELVRSGFFAKGVFRQLLRNTELYTKYLLASYHPSYLGDRMTRAALFGRLKGKHDYYSSEHRLLVQSEIQQLLRDDIPYFYTTFSSRALLSADGCVAEEFYRQSIEENFLEAVRGMNESDCFRQLYCLRRALTCRFYPKTRYYPVDPAVFSASEQSAQITALTDWIIELREKYFRIQPEKTEFPMYLANVPGSDNIMLKPEPPMLYAGIGSTLFYFQYAAVRKRGDARFAALLRSVSSPDSPLLTPLLLSGADRSIGVFDGQGSALYLRLYLYGATKDAQYLRSAEQLCTQIIPFARECRGAWDVMSGHAGLAICCLNAWYKLPCFTGLRSLAELCGEMLYEAYSTGQLVEQTGFSHGYAGISAAFLMLSGATDSEAYYAAGLDLMRKESEKYNPARNGWDTTDGYRSGKNMWCYGGPGILIARELARPFVKEEDRALVEHDIALALRCTKQAVASGEDRPLLCHGLAGNLSILQWYAKRSGDSSASQAAEQGVSRLLQILRDKGIQMRDATNTLQVSFMDGLSGLGYCLLQQLQPEIPSVLALEIP